MNLIAQLEQEEIARLGKTVPAFAPGDTVVVQVKGQGKARASVCRPTKASLSPSVTAVSIRASSSPQDLVGRRRRTDLSDLFAARRGNRNQAPRRRPPRQAVLPARALGQVGAHQGKAVAQAEGCLIAKASKAKAVSAGHGLFFVCRTGDQSPAGRAWMTNRVMPAVATITQSSVCEPGILDDRPDQPDGERACPEGDGETHARDRGERIVSSTKRTSIASTKGTAPKIEAMNRICAR